MPRRYLPNARVSGGVFETAQIQHHRRAAEQDLVEKKDS